MPNEQDKKPWQFSLKRALGAMTIICVTLAVAVPLFNTDTGSLSVVVAIMGICFAIGSLVGGMKGAASWVLVGLIVCAIFAILAEIL